MQLVSEGVHARPEVFNRIKIGRVRRPLQHVDPVIVDPCLHHFALERLGIVMQEPPLLMPRISRVRLIVVSSGLLNSLLQQLEQRLAFQLAFVSLAAARTARSKAGKDVDARRVDAAVHGVLRVEPMALWAPHAYVTIPAFALDRHLVADDHLLPILGCPARVAESKGQPSFPLLFGEVPFARSHT